MPTTKALSASKFFGKDRYEYYLNELLTQQKVGGNALSKSQIKEGFLKRKDKISFEKFVEKLLNTKAAKSAITPPEIKSSPVAGGVGLGSRGAEIVKSPIETPEIPEIPKQKEGFLGDKISFEKFVEKVISTKTAKSAITPPEIKSSPVADDSGVAVKKDKYEYYLNELLTQQKVGGNALSKSQIKEGFLKRKDKISFEKFVEKLLNTKAAKSAITPPEIKSSPVAGGVGLGSRGAEIVKSPIETPEIPEIPKQKEGFLGDKISFEKFVEKVISTKTAKSAITPPEIKSSPVAGGVGLGSRGGGLVKSPTGALEKYVSGVSKPQKMSGIEDDISKITKSVISIAEILSGQKKLKDSSTSYDRRKAEQEKRGLAESKLEKRFDGLKKAAEKILAPVKSLLDKIINFFVTVFLGRIVYKLLEWFGDPKNADKVKSISRFLGDHWPKLLALYLTFGTSVGRFALGLTKIVAKGAIKLLAKILLLSKAKKLSAAGRFLGGRGGNVVGAVLGTAAVVGGAYALTQGMKGDGEEPETSKPEKPEKPKVPGYAGGGIIKIPAFKGGGLNFKGMFGGALGSSPEKPEEMPNGFVSGEKGVDKVPAMLTDGEFVMSTGAVRKYGVDTLEGMNAAGGGTNRPKMMGGKTYAAGGGMMGNIPLDPSAGTNPDDNQFRRRARTFSQNGRFGTEEDLFKAFKKLGGIPDFQKMVGGSDNFSKINQGLYGDDALDTIRKSVVEKLKGVNNPQSKPTPQPQSFGGGKVGNIPEGMLDPDQPWYKNPRPKTWEILKAKLTGGTHNGTTYQSSVNLSNTDADKLIENLKKDPRGYPQVNVNDKYGGMENLRKYQAWLKETYLSQSKPTPQPQSKPTPQPKPQSSTKIGSALDNTTSALDDAIKSNKRGLRDTGFKLGYRIAPEHRMLPAAGQSSANMMKAVRAPIPASRAIVPYTGGGTLATQGGGGLATKPLQRINTNMNVTGGKSFGKSGLVSAIATTLIEVFMPQIQSAVGGLYDKMGIGMGNLSDKKLKKEIEDELKIQKGNSSGSGDAALLGNHANSSSYERMQLLQKELDKRNLNQGGAIKGGFGLKDQSFKDAPKTQMMTDDKGKPFVGYKSMKNGKLHYSRGPQPGGLSTNPFEAFGRAINPGAYKDNDAKLAMQNQRVAATNSLESLQARGASVDAQGRMMKQIGANSKQTQNDLTYRKNEQKKYANQLLMPTTKPKVNVIFGDIPKKSSFNPKSSSGASPKIPSFSAVHPNSESRRRNAAVLGVK